MYILNDSKIFQSTTYYGIYRTKPIIVDNHIVNFNKNYITSISPDVCPPLLPNQMIDVDIVVKGDITILKNYTFKQLYVELKNRIKIKIKLFVYKLFKYNYNKNKNK